MEHDRSAHGTSAELAARALYEVMEELDDSPLGPPWGDLSDTDQNWYRLCVARLVERGCLIEPHLFHLPHNDVVSRSSDVGEEAKVEDAK